MASISGAASSLGNTGLRGYGGFASGIDRDAIIEQMTAGTLAKITSQKNKITSLTWKQEAYRSISDKILDLQDKYFSYAASSNLKDGLFFAKNQITVNGKSDITKFVTARGSSSMLDYLSVLGTAQLARAATLISSSKGNSSITTNITPDSMNTTAYKSSLLEGRQLIFGTYDAAESKFNSAGTFTFPSHYNDVDADGKDITVDIDYTIDLDEVDPATGKTGGEKLAEQLNKALSQSDIKSGEDNISDVMQFTYKDGTMQLTQQDGKSTNLSIYSGSTALTALGFNPLNEDGSPKDVSRGISLEQLGENQNQFKDTYISKKTMVEYLAGKKLSISFGGQTKDIEFVKEGETFETFDDLKNTIQERLDKAFGSGNIEVAAGDNGGLEFKLGSGASPNMTLTVNSDSAEVRSVLGIKKGASNKLNISGSIADNVDKLLPAKPGETQEETAARRQEFLDTLDRDGLKINGVKIEGVTSDTSINGMMDKINGNKEAGVKASYISEKNQFVLVSAETGKGRNINLEGASDAMFGYKQDGEDESDGGFTEGQNAKILVSYGGGVESMIESTSNTFNIEGLSITVSGEFGDIQGEEGAWTTDKSQAVTFTAKADVEGVTEAVKKFMEAYNDLVKEISNQVDTKPDKAYGPLTEEQKAQMSDKSIEEWEKKAKEGLLYNDDTMRSLSMDVEGIMTQLLSDGAGYEDLKEMGITIPDNYKDGGLIVFDEAKFKAAMENEPDKVSDIFAGGGDVSKGLSRIIDDTMTTYATKYSSRNGDSYGRLIEEAGSEKIPGSIAKNQIYRQLTDMQEVLSTLQGRLKSEQDRYISQFTNMETMINQMNSQASYLDQFKA